MPEKLSLLPEIIHQDWEPFLTDEIFNLLEKISQQLERGYGSDYITPPKQIALRFLTLPLINSKVVILGQDPYPQEGVATGRAFEVGGLMSWGVPFRNVSLKNIVRAIYYAETGAYKTFTEVKQEIIGGWHIDSPNEIFKNWEKQGVLLLNTSFTCEKGKPGSHSKIWSEFTRKMLEYINTICPDLVWLLWGNHAQNVVDGMLLKNRIHSMHPMLCAQKDSRPTDFLYGLRSCFKETKNLINWSGKER